MRTVVAVSTGCNGSAASSMPLCRSPSPHAMHSPSATACSLDASRYTRHRYFIPVLRPSTLSHRQVTYPFLEEPALWFLPGKRQCALERRPRVGDPSQPPAQLGTRRMGEAVVAQIAAIENRVDERQSGRRTVAHRDGDGAIQLDHR